LAPATGVDERILILAPTGRDAELACAALISSGLNAEVVSSVEALCIGIDGGAGAALITEEALDRGGMQCLRDALENQPAWSDLPLLVFTYRATSDERVRPLDPLGSRANITMIERPIRVKTLISAAQAGLRARRRQYEVRQLVFELQQRLQERDHFLAMLSHELRNPLAAISLAVDSLGPERDGIANEHAILARQTRHLARLVDDLLDIARVTTGKIALHRADVDLADLAEHCVEGMRPRAQTHRIHLKFHQPRSGPLVHGDPVRLEQVINNLLSNAVKYTPAGGTIEVRVDAEADQAVLRVRDTGKGIAPDMLARIFELFTQGEATIDRSDGGMGVGLTLVKKLVELHRGTVAASSGGRGVGSEFVVQLPIVRRTDIRANRTLTHQLRDQGVRRHILFIEDNADIRDLLRLKLAQLGHRVDTAEDGLTGLQRIFRNPPEIAIIDIGLPGMDGYEVARKTRERLGNSVYLIALTGYGQTEDKSRALQAGFHVHLTKPADFQDLQALLVHAPRRHRSSRRDHDRGADEAR
jgi:signal transduction histidine kinase/ActR/RegA family two-component response regulator